MVGIKDVLKEEERIANSIAYSIKPLITPNFQFHTWRNRDVLIIDVAHSIGPYYLKQEGVERGVYVRLGSTNRIADRATILEIQRLTTHQSFDELPNIKAKTSDIDLSYIKELFSNVGKKFTDNTAKSLHLIVEHQSTYYPFDCQR